MSPAVEDDKQPALDPIIQDQSLEEYANDLETQLAQSGMQVEQATRLHGVMAVRFAHLEQRIAEQQALLQTRTERKVILQRESKEWQHRAMRLTEENAALRSTLLEKLADLEKYGTLLEERGQQLLAPAEPAAPSSSRTSNPPSRRRSSSPPKISEGHKKLAMSCSQFSAELFATKEKAMSMPEELRREWVHPVRDSGPPHAGWVMPREDGSSLRGLLMRQGILETTATATYESSDAGEKEAELPVDAGGLIGSVSVHPAAVPPMP